MFWFGKALILLDRADFKMESRVSDVLCTNMLRPKLRITLRHLWPSNSAVRHQLQPSSSPLLTTIPWTCSTLGIFGFPNWLESGLGNLTTFGKLPMGWLTWENSVELNYWVLVGQPCWLFIYKKISHKWCWNSVIAQWSANSGNRGLANPSNLIPQTSHKIISICFGMIPFGPKSLFCCDHNSFGNSL